MHLVLEGSGHDTFNDIVMLVALRYMRVMRYLRMFKPVRCGPSDWRMMHTGCFRASLLCNNCHLRMALGQRRAFSKALK